MGKGKPRPETCFGILRSGHWPQRTSLFVSRYNKTLETHCYFAILNSLKQCVKLVLRNNDSGFFFPVRLCVHVAHVPQF